MIDIIPHQVYSYDIIRTYQGGAMALSQHVTQLLDHGQLCSAVVGGPAIQVWMEDIGVPNSNQVLVLFDRRDAQHPQSVGMCMKMHDEEHGELEQQARQLMRGSLRQADGQHSMVHDFQGKLIGHRLVIVARGDIPEGLLAKMKHRCVESVLDNQQVLAA